MTLQERICSSNVGAADGRGRFCRRYSFYVVDFVVGKASAEMSCRYLINRVFVESTREMLPSEHERFPRRVRAGLSRQRVWAILVQK